MNQEKLHEFVDGKLIPFMTRFEIDNRGSRMGLEFIQGLGIILHNEIFNIVLEVQENASNRKS